MASGDRRAEARGQKSEVRSRWRALFAAVIRPVACLAATLSLSSALLAQELPIRFRDNPQFVPTPISRDHVTFPGTSSAPIRWKKSQPGAIRQVAHIDQVEHITTDVEADATGEQEIQPVAFTIRLDAPNNGEPNGVQTVAGTSKRTRPATQGESVLSSRRTTQRSGSVIKPQPAIQPTEEPELISPSGDEGEALAQDGEESESVLQLDDPPGPPEPEADPEDAAPVPPATLKPRATPQLVQQPGTRPLRDPAEVALPPVNGGGKKRCSKPNDRDCCADEKICTDQLARLTTSDKLTRYGKEALDITPRYSPNEKPEEHEANEERKAQQMTLAGRRQWQDKSGKVLAEGKLITIALGKAIVESDSGEPVELKLRSLSDDDLCFIAAWYSLPTECTLGNEPFQDRDFIASTMTWKASGVCHKPLYFEDVQLERYGHTRGPIVQPFVSGAHFFANVALLPYKMGINPPHECQYPLGYIRPGSCAPWMMQPFPLSARGAATAVGVYTGGNFLIP